jgi:hypothetical protein
MRRFFSLSAVALLALSFGLTACGGGGSSTGAVSTVTISPTFVSLTPGGVQQLTITATDKNSTQIFNQITTATSDNANVSVTSTGLVCAGTWDSLTTPIVCTPSTTVPVTANLTIAVGGVSATVVPVYVHKAVDRFTVHNVGFAEGDCQSQADPPLNISAQAFSGTDTAGQPVDITSTVGPINFFAADTSVVTFGTAGTDCAGTTGKNDTICATPSVPGTTSIYASVTGIQSMPITFTTCPVEKVSLHVKDATTTSFSIDKSATQTLVAEATDSAGKPVQNVFNSSSVLTASVNFSWISSPSPAASATPVTAAAPTAPASATVTGLAPGTATIIAACVPHGSTPCNVNMQPVYSNSVVASVNGTANTTTAYVASTDSTSLLPIDTSANTVGTAVTLPFKPNSMMVTLDGSKLFLGSASGLMIVTTAANSVSSVASAVGTVIGVSPDSSSAVVAGQTKLYIYNVGNSSITTFNLAGITQVGFSPDGYKLYMTTGNSLYVATSTGGVPQRYTLEGTANNIAFLANGPFGFIAESSPSLVGVRATCDDSAKPSASVTGAPLFLASLPSGTGMLALSSEAMNEINVSTDNAGCPPSVANTVASHTLASDPSELLLTSNGQKALVIDKSGKAYVYDRSTSTPTITPITLTGTATGTTGGVLLAGTGAYVGGVNSDGTTFAVHRIDLTSNSDAQQITSTIRPDFVVVLLK